MATENVPVFNKYEGNGAATEFSIGFPYLDTNFIKVYIKRIGEEEEKLDDSRFSFVNDTTIKFPVLDTDTVLQEGEVITIQRETSLGSDYEFDNQIRLFPEEVMNADDLSFQQIQELARDLERAVKVKPTDEKTSDELIDEVYGSLSSAIDIAGDAINAANQAQQAADNAIASVEEAQKQVIAVTEYTDQKKAEIDNIVKEAEESVDSTIASAVEEVRQSALDAAYEAINDAAAEATTIVVEYTNKEIKPQLNEIANNASESAENASESAGLAAEEAEEAKHWAEDSRVWATGEDTEVDELESGEHSARVYSELAKAGAVRAEEAEARIGDVVHIDGDETITGQKTFETTNEKTLDLKAMDIDSSVTPDSDVTQGIIAFKDNLGEIFGYLFGHKLANGSIQVGFQAKDSSDHYSTMTVGVNSEGTAYMRGVTLRDYSLTSNDLATTSWVKNLLGNNVSGCITYSRAENGYIRFPNGIQICWGRNTTGSSTTFAKAFTTVYAAVASMVVADNAGYSAYVHTVNTTAIKTHRYNNATNTTCHFIVIGRS